MPLNRKRSGELERRPPARRKGFDACPLIHLSPTEKRYLQLYDAGKSNKQIADELHITVNTARTHGRNILVKTMCACLRESACKIGGVRIR